MFCTRWFLPLLILPLPIAPSYILILYILSTALHAQACFNCIIVLTALFLSSCYWQPVPVDAPLHTPWSENITTLSHALDSMLPSNITIEKPPVVQFIDRCWCDLTSGVFFQPFNVTKWEYDSLELYVDEMIRRQKLVDNKIGNGTSASEEPEPPVNGTVESQSGEWTSTSGSLRRALRSFFTKSPSNSSDEPTNVLPEPELLPSTPELPRQARLNYSRSDQDPSPSSNRSSLSWYQQEYNLQQYGFDVVVEFGWDRKR